MLVLVRSFFVPGGASLRAPARPPSLGRLAVQPTLAKVDPPGTMRCPMCGGKFTDAAKLEKHFAALHTREHIKRLRGNQKRKPRPAELARRAKYSQARSQLGDVMAQGEDYGSWLGDEDDDEDEDTDAAFIYQRRVSVPYHL